MTRAEFSKKTKLQAWERSGGHCECYMLRKQWCGRLKIVGGPEYHHLIEAEFNGSNDLDNCVVLSRQCHRTETSTYSKPVTAKVTRIREKRQGVRASKGRPMAGTKRSGLRKRMDGTVERR